MISKRLLRWSLFSMMSGFPMWLDTHRPIKAIGAQFIGWGAIDALIALFGTRAAAKRYARLPNPEGDETVAKERRNLVRILWLNAGLDVLYMLGGYRLTQQQDAERKGHGIGIIIQGAFLFLFDLYHALRAPKHPH